ncbi:hypothetical protein, partial [Phocaeicola vulgatus]|uniref:hypothetical protein n=1 Tax=Phocaeicola vulgatus TaxID=821 RepID=UPI00202E501F
LLPDLSLGIDGGVQRFGEYTMDGVGNSTTNTPDLEKEDRKKGKCILNNFINEVKKDLFRQLFIQNSCFYQ